MNLQTAFMYQTLKIEAQHSSSLIKRNKINHRLEIKCSRLKTKSVVNAVMVKCFLHKKKDF